MKRRISYFVISLVVVLLFDALLSLVVGIVTEEESNVAVPAGNFKEIMLNGNKNITLNDYILTNWGRGKQYQQADEAVEVLSETSYNRLGRISSAFVEFLQTKENSVAEIWLNKIDGITALDSADDLNGVRTWFNKANNGVKVCEIVRILGSIMSSIR